MRLPVGESDLRIVVDRNFDFVDKSLIIKEVIDDDQVILITRPRRFGKTFNLSILRYFFEKNLSKKISKSLYSGLKINKVDKKYLSHQSKYPVISFSFKDIKGKTFECAYTAVCKVIKELYSEHRYLLDSKTLPKEDKFIYESILKQEARFEDIANSLKDLIKYLHNYHKSQILVLIDEYDTPIQCGYLHNYYQEVVDFFRGFFGAALKDNTHLFKSVLTGILKVSKESLFSGLNNVVSYSMLSAKYSSYFGFTEEEVEHLLKKARLETQFDQVKKWYNGYQSGGYTLYNPWSIANFIKEHELKHYWINTSDNALINDMLIHANINFKKQFELLLAGKSIQHVINENFVFTDINKNHESAIWSFMFMAGYLKVNSYQYTARGHNCQLTIPNTEIRNLYQNIVEEWLSSGRGITWYDNFIDHLLKGEISQFAEDLYYIMEQTVSVHDVAREPEAFYHGLIIGLTASLYSNKNYELRSNRESGDGRYDYLIISRDPARLSILIEFKKADSSSLENSAKSAVKQINLKNYLAEAEQRQIKNLIKIGIAFNGKKFAIHSEK